MPTPLLSLLDISLTFGAAPLLSGAGLAVAAGDRICLVGRNGSRPATGPGPSPKRTAENIF